MLSRTADNLFWMARYIERAENTARVMGVAHLNSLLPSGMGGSEARLWSAPLSITGCEHDYAERFGVIEADAVSRYLALDPDSPSSIYASLSQARENARAVRGAITSEMWESINATWLEFTRMIKVTGRENIPELLDWVKERSHLFRGVTAGTILKDTAYSFIRLGTMLERADNTARILDVKYHILLPSVNDVGGAADYYQWGALLRSVSSLEAYRKIYRDIITPLHVAELLILNPHMPRSLHACMNEVDTILEDINGSSGREARRLAGELHAALHYGRIDSIFSDGLHEYLIRFLKRTARLGQEIRKGYLARRDEFTVAAPPRVMLEVQ
jgi:uncharacterized alpha-E superfamily protein